MKMKFRLAKTIPEFADLIGIRVEVFIIEQGFNPGWEPDNYDKEAKHYIALDGKKIIATARARESAKKEYKIERMAVRKKYRHQGVGGKLLKYIIKDLKKSKPKKIWTISQEQASYFYEKNGFKKISKPYEHYGAIHVDMEHE